MRRLREHGSPRADEPTFSAPPRPRTVAASSEFIHRGGRIIPAFESTIDSLHKDSIWGRKANISSRESLQHFAAKQSFVGSTTSLDSFRELTPAATRGARQARATRNEGYSGGGPPVPMNATTEATYTRSASYHQLPPHDESYLVLPRGGRPSAPRGQRAVDPRWEEQKRFVEFLSGSGRDFDAAQRPQSTLRRRRWIRPSRSIRQRIHILWATSTARCCIRARRVSTSRP